MVAVFVPMSRTVGSEETVSVSPAGPMLPDDGVIVIHGLSAVAAKIVAGFCPARTIACVTAPLTPISALVWRDSGRTKIATGVQNGPRSSLQALIPRTRQKSCTGLSVAVCVHVAFV